MSKPDIVIDKVKYDGTKVRLEFQRLRKDNRYDEAVLGSFDVPLQSFREALASLVVDVCQIIECPEAYADKLAIRGVSFTDTDGTRGACITALKSVKTAKSPLVLNTPHLTFEPMNDGDQGPFLPDDTIGRLERLEAEAIRYINGDREQPLLPLDVTTPPPANEGVITRARRLGEDIGQALTDPNNPIVQQFAKKMKNCSLIAGGRRLDIDDQGGITAGPDTKQPTEGDL